MRKDKSIQTQIDQINAAYGKLPPQAIDAEEAVLGAAIIEADAYEKISSIVSEKSFYKEAHQIIFLAVKSVYESGRPVDMLLVSQELRDSELLDDVGGPTAVVGLTSKVASAAHIEHHARIIQQKYLRREIIRMSSEISADAYKEDNDIDDVLANLIEQYNSLVLVPYNNIQMPGELMSDVYGRMKHNYTHDGSITGKPYGIGCLDRFTSGIQTTDLTIIAAEPSMGKTSFAITVMNNLTEADEAAAAISLEMTGIQIMARVVAQETGVSSKKVLMSKLSDTEIKLIDSVRKDIEKKKLYIDPDCSSELTSILATIRFLHKTHGVRTFVIDYLQLISMADSKSNREGQLAFICRSLKNLAKELDVAIILLSQLNREQNKKDRPSLSRLRGSGQIEEAADNVIFIYRPEYHGLDFMEDETPSQGRAELIIGKGRNIGTATFVVNFEPHTGRFYEGDIVYQEHFDPDQFHSSSKEEPF